MPKAKPVSLWPLSFEEAITAIIRADPTHMTTTSTETKASNSGKPAKRSPELQRRTKKQR